MGGSATGLTSYFGGIYPPGSADFQVATTWDGPEVPDSAAGDATASSGDLFLLATDQVALEKNFPGALQIAAPRLAWGPRVSPSVEEGPDAGRDTAGEWTTVPLTLCARGFVLNEREQYHAWDSVRELINNHYDAGATEVRVDVSDSEIRISGNGRLIDDPAVLTEVFTDNKRGANGNVDIDGNGRETIGEKGRGRFAFVRDADELTVSSRFGELRLSVTEDQGIEASVSLRRDDGRATADKTVCALKRRNQTFDLEDQNGIRNYLMDHYLFFKGKNVRIILNGEEIPMREFVPHFSAWLVMEHGYSIRDQLRHADSFSTNQFQDSQELLDDQNEYKNHAILVYDPEMARFLEEKGEKLYRVDIAFFDNAGMSIGDANTLLMSKRNPVDRKTTLSTDFSIAVAVDTDLPLDPSRKTFAAHVFIGGSVDGDHIERTLRLAVDRAFESYFEKNYKRHGWDKFHKYRTLQVLSMGKISVPDLELEVQYHADHATDTRVMTLAQLAKETKEKPVIIYDSRDSAYMHAIDKLIQRGHPGLKLTNRQETSLLKHNGVVFVEAGTEEFEELAVKLDARISNEGAISQAEYNIRELAETVCGLLKETGLSVNIATVASRETIAIFIGPDQIIINRTAPNVSRLIDDAGGWQYLDDCGVSLDNVPKFYSLLMRVAPIVIAEIAHLSVLRQGGGDEKLEHEKTIVKEKNLYERFLLALSEDIAGVVL